MRPYQIIEVANCHGGDIDYLFELIRSFEPYKEGFGIKFQPFKYDALATESYQWYPVYKQLFFDENQWSRIIGAAAESKDVWLDLFDNYGAQILRTNFEKITGLKLQASVLYNYSLLNELSLLDLSSKKIIVNISSYSIEEIDDILDDLGHKLNPSEFFLEIGFQSYPTQLEDSGLSKISALKNHFKKKLVFADHLSGEIEDSIWLPVMSSLLGVDIIEKHVMHGTRETKYDHYSSITPDKFKRYIETLDKYSALLEEPYINSREIDYVKNSILIPLLSTDKARGETISIDKDLLYQRSGSSGLNTRQLRDLLNNFYVLSNDIKEGSAIQRRDLKKANIAVIVACRLKSNRLKKKALLKIGETSSVERCIKSAMKFDNINHVVLATSTLEEDAELVDYTYSPSVVFYRGDPDDVIQRYLGVTNLLKIDVVVRVTADMPYIDNEVLQILLRSHFEQGADYTAAKEAAVGTNLEIINVRALQRIKAHFKRADYSEYMTWYFKNNPEFFRLNYVELPEGLVRDYRMTLDYQEDLDMFNHIENHFRQQNRGEFGLREIYEFLDKNKSIAEINGHLTLKYKTDQDLIDTLNRETKM